MWNNWPKFGAAVGVAQDEVVGVGSTPRSTNTKYVRGDNGGFQKSIEWRIASGGSRF